MYSAQIADHIANPRNVGEIENASGVGDVTNEVCLDRIRLSIRIKDDRVAEARVKASGCPPTIAAASALTELIIGKPVEEVSSLTRRDIVIALGRLPPAKSHCSALAIEALHAAIDDAKG
jgi:nitrogen fixation NifU-like protein